MNLNRTEKDFMNTCANPVPHASGTTISTPSPSRLCQWLSGPVRPGRPPAIRPRRGRTLFRTLKFLMLALLAVLPFASVRGGDSVDFYILDMNNKGIPGLHVIEWRGGDKWEFDTGSDGKFTDGYSQKNKTYNFVITNYNGQEYFAAEYRNPTQHLTNFLFKYPGDLSQRPFKFTVTRGPIMGRVTYKGVQTGVAGLVITNSSFSSITATTDKDGKYVLPNVTYTTTAGVVPPGAGYVFSPQQSNAPPGRINVNFELVSAPISGRVTLDGLGLPGVEIQFYKGNDTALTTKTNTDSAGNFFATNLLGGVIYRVRPVLAGFSFDNYELVNQKVGDTPQFKVKTGPIRGWIKDAGGQGVRDIQITAKQGGSAIQTGTSAADGSFAFANLAVGYYTLAPQSADLELPSAVSAKVGDTNIVIAAGYHFSGTVKSATTVNPVPDVVMDAHMEDGTLAGSARTGPNGDYILSGLAPNQPYTLRPVSPGLVFLPASASVTLDSSKTSDFTAYAIVQGRITQSGSGVTGVIVTATNQNGEVTGTATSTTDGAYTLKFAVNAGQMTVSASRTDFVFVPATQTARPGPTATNVDFQASGGVSGRIMFQDGTAAPGITVNLKTSSGQTPPTRTATTGADGHYTLAAIPEGSAIIEPEQTGYAFDPAGISTNTGTSGVDFKVTQSPPAISAIPDQYVSLSSRTVQLPFTVSDKEQSPAELQVTSDSSNPDLVGNGSTNIVIIGQGADRKVQVIPGAGKSGSATITLTVGDGFGGEAFTRFDVLVNTEPAYWLSDLGTSTGGCPTNSTHPIYELNNPLYALTPGGSSVARDTNDLGLVVGQALTSSGSWHAFLYRGDTLYDLNDLIPPETGWVLTNACAIQNSGEIFGVGQAGDTARAFAAIPAVVAGKPISSPAGAVANQQGIVAEIRILNVLPAEYPTNKASLFLWSDGDQKLFALAGGVQAEISWRTNDSAIDPGRVKTTVYTVWPRRPQIQVVGAPAELEPPEVPSFAYRIFGVPFSTAGVNAIDPATRVFNAPQPGYSVLQYYETGGEPPDPLHHHVLLQVVRSYKYDTAPFDINGNKRSWEIGQAISPSNSFSTAVFTLPGNSNDLAFVAKAIGAQYDGLHVEFTYDSSLTNGPKATYDGKTLIVSYRSDGLTSADVIAAMSTLTNCPYMVRPANGETSGGTFGTAALCLDGTNQYASAGWLNLSNTSFTIEAWAKRHTIGGFNAIAGMGTNLPNQALYFAFRGNNNFTFGFYANDLDTPDTYTDTNWHHWAGTFNVTNMTRKIFRDGVLVASDTALGALQASGPLLIGTGPYDPWDSLAFDGEIKDVRVWKVARSEAQVRDNINTALAGDEPGLAAYYRLNDAEGNLAQDSRLNTLDLTAAADSLGTMPTRTTNVYSSSVPDPAALSFAGSPSSYVNVVNSADLAPLTPFTWESWIKVTKTSWAGLQSYATIMSIGLTNGTCWFAVSSNGNVVVALGNQFRQTSVHPIAFQTWQHVAVTWDGSDVRCYLNGQPDSTNSYSGIVPYSGQPLYIGRGYTLPQSFSFKGQMNELRMWWVARSQEEIQSTMHQSLSDFEPGLAAYWPLTQPTTWTDGFFTYMQDLTWTAHDGRWMGPPPIWPSSRTLAWQFDGVDDSLTVPHQPALNAFPLTITAWIYTGQTNYQTLLGKYDMNTGEGYQLYLKDGAVGAMYQCGARGGVGTNFTLRSGFVADSNWCHVAFVVTSNSSAQLWINGNIASSASWYGSPGPASNTLPLTIGSGPGLFDGTNQPGHYQGLLDQVTLWTTALATSDIQKVMNGFDPSDPRLLAGYRADYLPDWGDGLTVLNRSSYDMVAALINSPTWTFELPAPQFTGGGMLEHDDYPTRNGFVLFANAFYDGAGVDRAYDRSTRRGPIIPVNRLESGTSSLVGGDTNKLVVVWYHRDGIGVGWPDRPVLFDPQWPTNAEQIIISAQKDAPTYSSSLYPNKRIYSQPDPHSPGFNPNEEHAAIFDNKVTALRDDLNSLLNYSRPFTLLKYQNPFTGEWQMKVFAVTNSGLDHPFRYPQQAAQEIQPPFPLNLLSLCGQTTNWSGPLWRDYKGKIYAYAAGPGLSHADAVIRYHYPLQPDFYYPFTNTITGQPYQVGDCVPWLSQWSANKRDPINVTYDIRWPDNVPTMQLGSTLVTSRDGLPEIFGQAKAEVLFEGVNPVNTVNGQTVLPPGYATNSGVRLFDPLSERSVSLPSGFLLPGDVKTQLEAASGRKQFPALPYHLRCRLLYDEPGKKLIFRGFTVYKDQPPQDPLVLPNVMTDGERTNIVSLVPGNSTWKQKVADLFDLTRNPNQVDADFDGIPDKKLLIGLATFTNAVGVITVGPETLGAGAKALSAAVSLSDAAANLLSVPGPKLALSFNAGGAYLAGNNIVGLAAGNVEHTIEAWVRVDARPAAGNTSSLLSLGQAAGGSPHQWFIDSSGVGYFGGQMGTSNLIAVPLPLTNWVHLASVYDGVTCRVYTNGVEAGSSTNCAFDLRGIPLVLAKSAAGSSGDFNGALAEVRVWNQARTAAEIRRYRDISLRGDEAGLVAYWRLDATNASSVVDASGYGNTGQLVNDPQWITLDTNLVWQPNGYVTLAFNNDPSLPGLPVTLKVIRLDPSAGFYAGDLRMIASDNVFDERLTLRHSADFGFEPEKFEFEWYYHPGGDTNPIPNTEQEIASFDWRANARGTNYNYITLGAGGEAGALVISDNRWIMRFRPTTNNPLIRVLGNGWGDWAGAPNKVPKEAMLAEGWVKRVTDALNPFDARTADFRDSEVNTYASLLVSAGCRYEGDIAFNPDADNVNKVGLIEAYQTVLERGRDLSIDAGTESGPADEALLNATSKIADLYTMLGNEAYADAEDPTIGFTTPDGEVGSLAPSIFAFQNQLDSLLEEELGLLRGLDQNLGRPVYNRLPWNFTGGDGQLAYQQVYNIYDTQTRDPITGQIVPPDGFIDANDAATLYPQGHGDAWGHYLTAITSYYTLLWDTNFLWQPRAEHMLLAGVPVDVDYQDERKFATIAAAKAKTGAEIVNLTYRENYVDDPAGQWQGYKDTDPERAWGVDGWGRRAGQGAYFDWVVANAILPSEDLDHQGIEKIDRTTVPELSEIASEYQSVQSQLDQADVGLNPLGLAKGAVPFDIDPAALAGGVTHFDQIYERALKAMNNAVTVFNHANDITRNLRRTQDSAADYAKNVEDQERDYRNRLIEIFGYPYSGTLGAGQPYASSYDGPDLLYFNYVDTSELTGSKLPGPTQQVTALFNMVSSQIADIPDVNLPTAMTVPVTYPLSDQGWSFTAPASWGTRRAPGEIQSAISELLQAQANFQQALSEYDNLLQDIQDKAGLLKAQYNVNTEEIEVLTKQKTDVVNCNKTIKDAVRRAGYFQQVANTARDVGGYSMGLAQTSADEGNVAVSVWAKLTSSFLAAAAGVSYAVANIAEIVVTEAQVTQSSQEQAKEELELQNDITLQTADNRYEVQQAVAEMQSLVREEVPKRVALYNLKELIAAALGDYQIKLAEGQRLLEERDAFRQRTAGVVSQNRYSDMAFRVFRNDAIQKYRAQFDVAAKYVSLAASAYDYETTMLGNQTGAGRQFLTDIVKQRALGEWVDGQPVIGRYGLADSLGRLSANWDILKTQLGINNPEHEDAFFSLSRELFRQNPEGYTNNINLSSDLEWKQVLRNHVVANLWDIPEFRRYCRAFAPESAGPQPGLVIPFSTTINFGLNFFGWPLGPNDGSYDSSRFATKIRSAGLIFSDYPTNGAGGLGLSRTPRVYLVPVGTDILRAASGSDITATREFKIVDQKIPVPFPIGYSDVNNPDYMPERDSLSGSFIEIRRYASFYAFPYGVDAFDPGNDALTESRLIGRSVWNTRWMLIVPGGTFLYDPNAGLDTFIDSVSDITVYFRTYSYSGD